MSLIKGHFKATSFSNIGHSRVLDIFFATERGLLDLNSIRSKHQMQSVEIRSNENRNKKFNVSLVNLIYIIYNSKPSKNWKQQHLFSKKIADCHYLSEITEFFFPCMFKD